MGIVFGVGLVIAAAAYLTFVVLSDGAKSAGHWTRRRTTVVGESPYRTTASTEEVWGGAPIWLRCVCWLAAMGGLATLGLFVPVGLLLSDVSYDHEMSVLFLVLVSLSGVPAGMVLIRVACKTMRHEAVGDASFLYLYIHHAWVVDVMFLVHLFSRGEIPVQLTIVVVCVVLFIAVIAMDCVAPASDQKPRLQGHRSAG